MLGPLPIVYRVIVALSALAAFAGLGAWLAIDVAGPALASTGAGLGLGIGAVVVLLLLHDFEHREGHPHRVRVHSRTPRR